MRENKELNNARARKSRLRKKKYFEELEEKVKQLETELTTKDAQISELQMKLIEYEYEGGESSAEDIKKYKKYLIKDCVKILQQIPDKQAILFKEKELSEKFDPYGSERLKIINAAFSTIIDNLLPDSFRIFFKYIEKNIPKNLNEYQKYMNTKKYVKSELWNDTKFHEFINHLYSLNPSEEQLNNFFENIREPIIEVKQEMKDGVSLLLDARNSIFKSMAKLDGCKHYFSNQHSTKDQIIQSIIRTNTISSSINPFSIWNINKRQIKTALNIELKDKELFNQTIENANEDAESQEPQKDNEIKEYIIEEMFIED